MKERIALWEEGKIPFYNEDFHIEENADACTMTPYLIEDGKEHGMVLVFPGGGYVRRVPKEAEPVAHYLNSIGMHAVVVDYRVLPYDPSLGIVDGKRAMRIVRSKAKEWKILDGAIGVMGFSAGAGNASRLCESFDVEDYEPQDALDRISAKPDFCVLCYGALSLDLEHLIQSDIDNFNEVCPEEEREDYINANSPDRNVRADMPPVFIWHCIDDKRVKAGAALSFVNALYQKGVDTEFHMYPLGGHGKCVRECVEVPGLRQWLTSLENWLNRKGFVKRIKDCTLCYIEQDGKYLMLHRTKKENDLNEGKWIGVGGKVEPGETPRECVVREAKEETGLTLTNVVYRGIVHFQSDKWSDEEMYLYTADAFEGELTEDCSEGELAWVSKEEVMKLPTWEGDRYFLQDLLEDKKGIDMVLRYEGETLVEVTRKYVDEFGQEIREDE